MAEFTFWRDPLTLNRRFNFVLTDQDLFNAYSLLKNDQLLLTECENSASIADKLIGLECMFRRVEQSNG
jgi:hypothetical protein